MRSGIHPVWRKAYLIDCIHLKTQEILGRGARHCIIGKNHNAVVIMAYAKLILCAEHSKGLHTANLRFLHLKFCAVREGKFCANSGQHHLFARSHIWRAAYNLQQLRSACIHLCNVQVVRIRMLHALHNLCNNYTCQTTWNLLNLLAGLNLQANSSKNMLQLLRREVEIHILL